jgi:hypothetical protein
MFWYHLLDNTCYLLVLFDEMLHPLQKNVAAEVELEFQQFLIIRWWKVMRLDLYTLKESYFAS